TLAERGPDVVPRGDCVAERPGAAVAQADHTALDGGPGSGPGRVVSMSADRHPQADTPFYEWFRAERAGLWITSVDRHGRRRAVNSAAFSSARRRHCQNAGETAPAGNPGDRGAGRYWPCWKVLLRGA